MSYAQSLGLLAGFVLLVGIPVIALGPEAKGAAFMKAETWNPHEAQNRS
jgi:cbb3-type cytochrome oxidase subunit 3